MNTIVEVRTADEQAILFRSQGQAFTLELSLEALDMSENALQEALRAIDRLRKTI